MWHEIGTECQLYPLIAMELIIDEGLDMGFEFKVENHTLYYREREE